MAESLHRMSNLSVYLNGEILPDAQARLPITDQGLLYGFGFFETFRTSGGNPHHWNFNRARIEGACATSGLGLPRAFLAANETKLAAVVRQLLRESGLTDAVFRYTVTAGSGDLPSELLTLRPLPPPAIEPITLRVLKLRRDSGEWVPRPKSLNYLNTILGVRELRNRKAGASDEGLFLSRGGEFVVETARQNVAWIAAGRIGVPDENLGAVAGTCLAWTKTRGLPMEPRRAGLSELLEAEAAFVINSVRGITPVAEVWNETDTQLLRKYPAGGHPAIMALQQGWQQALEGTANSRMSP
jgi:4-amino-4-deoxychorismate lyase